MGNDTSKAKGKKKNKDGGGAAKEPVRHPVVQQLSPDDAVEVLSRTQRTSSLFDRAGDIGVWVGVVAGQWRGSL